MQVSRLWSPVTRWGDFRRRQLAALEESNRIAAEELEVGGLVAPDGPHASRPDAAPVATAGRPRRRGRWAGHRGWGAGRSAGRSAGWCAGAAPDAAASATASGGQPSTYGVAGRPLNRHSPFYIGFLGAIGALLAIGLWNLVGRLTTTLTLLIVSMFLALALNPLVDALVARGARRPAAVGLVFAGLLVAFGLIAALVIPPVVVQGTELAQQAPTYVENVLGSPWVREIDKSYDVIDKIQAELQARMTDQQFLEGVLAASSERGAPCSTASSRSSPCSC